MSELLEPADAGGGNRPVAVASGELASGAKPSERAASPALRLAARALATRHSVLLCERVSQVVRPGHRRQPGDAGAAARHHRPGRLQRRRQEHAACASSPASCGPTWAASQVLGHDAWTRGGQAARRLLPRGGRLLRGDVRPAVRRGDGPAVRLRRRARRGGGPRRRWSWSAWPAGPSGGCAATPRACGSASSWPRRCSTIRNCWSSTSRSAASTRSAGPEFIALFRELAEQGKCLLVSSHELDELEKLTDHVAIMARGRIAAVGTVAQIRDLLDDHPLTVRVDVARGDGDGRRPPARLGRGAAASAGRGRRRAAGGRAGRGRRRPAAGPRPQPAAFFQDLTRLVLEEWYEVRRLETLDESAQAVLGYLLGGRA